ncbi:rod shape-determining protein [Candidatus Curtissbacteria bacterium RIFCSPHIGHO2_01_FULL_41_11]|uniref:Cell shape-determining protein MreB n=1 Tax=Candidatus Curtissbacteria bacterium RIFCSPHIGHO2_01_FULL_41_11 TaxID=1797711 RepID=A0A1F5G4C6_9BACT|nr:MAG: rod shape-determining protein [Candidatus Curtissbacteria bacterium RIFCSPHIGHO2_01_FULL_41_11]
MIPILDHIFGKFSEDLGIDLGTANTLVAVRGKGIVIREPSIIIRHRKTKNVIAIGSEAKKMLGKTPFTIEAVRPLRDGVIADFDTTLAMLSYFVRKIHARPGRSFSIPRPKVVIGIPSNISEVERRAVLDAARASGARMTFLVEEPMAAAIGADLPVTEPLGSMIVDIGGGTCEIAIISLGGVVVGKSLKIAGDAMDGDIAAYIRSRYSLAIGERTAEQIKIALGSAYPQKVEKEMVVRGRDLEKGLPRTIRVSSVAVREALASSVSAIVNAIRDVIEDAPPELSSDIAERGIVMCGGGSMLSGFSKLVSKETKMPVILAADPLSCVVIGATRILDSSDLLNKVKIASG